MLHLPCGLGGIVAVLMAGLRHRASWAARCLFPHKGAFLEQLTFDLDKQPCKALSCEHRHYKAAIDRVWCDRGAGFYTMCGLPFCGELAGCAYDEPDNSPEAMARRRAWIAANE